MAWDGEGGARDWKAELVPCQLSLTPTCKIKHAVKIEEYISMNWTPLTDDSR
jgi:hypothetical protein